MVSDWSDSTLEPFCGIKEALRESDFGNYVNLGRVNITETSIVLFIIVREVYVLSRLCGEESEAKDNL
jgi:hypothetical protein